METGTTAAKTDIAFADIGVADELLIRTLHSLYRFFITDPVKYYGRLTGGVFKDSSVRGLLCMTSSLRIGSCACFLVESGDRHKILRTSIITNLTHIKSSMRGSSHPSFWGSECAGSSSSSESHQLQTPSSQVDRGFDRSSLANRKSKRLASEVKVERDPVATERNP